MGAWGGACADKVAHKTQRSDPIRDARPQTVQTIRQVGQRRQEGLLTVLKINFRCAGQMIIRGARSVQRRALDFQNLDVFVAFGPRNTTVSPSRALSRVRASGEIQLMRLRGRSISSRRQSPRFALLAIAAQQVTVA